MLMITDTTSHRVLAPLVETVKKALFAAGIDCAVYDEVNKNPTTEHVESALVMAEEVAPDCLVSVGGGSTHDAAKAVRALYGNLQQASVYDIEGVEEIAEGFTPLLKHVTVSTTSGSSAELSRLAIITDTVHHEKISIIDPRLTPTVTCNDTLLLLSQPPDLVASSGMQALSHAMEAFLSTASSPITDAAALHAIRLIHAYLRRAVQSPKPLDEEDESMKAHEMLTYAEFLSGLAFNSAGLGLTHTISNQMSALYPSVSVSECTSVVLPHVLQYYGEQGTNEHGGKSKNNVVELFVDLAAALGCSASATYSATTAVPAVIRSVARLASDVNQPETIKELNARVRAGMKIDDIPEIAAKALTDPGGMTAPRHPSLGEMESLICRAWDSGLTGTAAADFLKETPVAESHAKHIRVKSSEYVDFNDAAAAMIEENEKEEEEMIE